MDEEGLINALMTVPLFEGLDYDQISRILQLSKQREFEPGTVLCEALTVDKRLVIFLQGKLRLESAEGVPLAEVSSVRVIGEMGVLTGQTRSSRVVAVEASTVLELEAADLDDLFEAEPDMANKMLVNLITILYARVHDANQDIEMLRDEVDRLRNRLGELAPDDPLVVKRN